VTPLGTHDDSSTTRAWLQIHFCVLLWGFTAILGRLITLPAMTLVLDRMVLVTVALCLLPGFWRGLRGLSARMRVTYASIGVVVALHWLTFYTAIKWSNASATASCMALSPVFTALIEPLSLRRRPEARDLAFALAVIPGAWLVTDGTPATMHLGIAVGVLSALLGAAFSVLNKRFVASSGALATTGIEMASGALLIAVLGPLFVAPSQLFVMPSARDGALLVILALGCTLLPFALWLVVLRKLSAFATMLAVNMEPVYTMLLAALLLSEQHELQPRFYLGVTILVGVVVAYPLVTRRIVAVRPPAQVA
jgi:drug/metabolite transporter (DMT)-like permease